MQHVLKSIAVVVGIPTLVAIVYFGFIASDIYVSETKFAIRSSDGSSPITGLAAILTSSGSGTGQESSVVQEYMHSSTMLGQLLKRLPLEEHYRSGKIDWLARLKARYTQEELLEYMVEHLHVLRDTSSDVLTLKARAFDPVMAKSLAEEVILLSEDLVNRMSTRIEEDSLKRARYEVELASDKVTAISTRLSRFRVENESIDPAQEGSALLGVLSGIESRLVETRTELNEKQAYMRDGAPEIIALKNRLNALEKQRRIERSRLIDGDSQSRELSDVIEDYRPLVIEQELAQQQYASALTSLELARAEVSRQKQYLITFVEPNLPDEALEPRRVNKMLTVLTFSFLFYLIGGLMWSALRDHIGR